VILVAEMAARTAAADETDAVAKIIEAVDRRYEVRG
jgi:hypothetical protein